MLEYVIQTKKNSRDTNIDTNPPQKYWTEIPINYLGPENFVLNFSHGWNVIIVFVQPNVVKSAVDKLTRKCMVFCFFIY